MTNCGVAVAPVAESAVSTRDDQLAVVWAGFGASVREVEGRRVRLALDLHEGPMHEHVGTWPGDVRIADKRGYDADSSQSRFAAGVDR